MSDTRKRRTTPRYRSASEPFWQVTPSNRPTPVALRRKFPRRHAQGACPSAWKTTWNRWTGPGPSCATSMRGAIPAHLPPILERQHMYSRYWLHMAKHSKAASKDWSARPANSRPPAHPAATDAPNLAVCPKFLTWPFPLHVLQSGKAWGQPYPWLCQAGTSNNRIH